MITKAQDDVKGKKADTTYAWTRFGFWRGVKAGLPVAVSVAAYGLVFGVLARQAGLTLLELMLMNVLVFAGAAQTAALELWNYPLPVVAIVATTLLINLRLLLLGASIRPWLGRFPARRVYPWLHILADEGWALAMGRHARGERDAGFLMGALSVVAFAWIPSAAIGHLAGDRIGDPATIGLDFAFTTVFAAILFGTWRGWFDLVPWSAAGICAYAAWSWLPGTWYVVVGAVAGCAVAAIRADPNHSADLRRSKA